MYSTVFSGNTTFMPRENDEPYSSASFSVGVCITSISTPSGSSSE